MALLLSPLLHDTLTKSVATRQYFYKISNYFYKSQILIWHLFTEAQILFLATTHKSPNVDLTPIFYKAQILIWHLFTKAQILFWQLFHKAQILI